MTEHVPSDVLQPSGSWHVFKHRCRQTFGVISWIFPLAIMLFSWLLFGAMSDRVSWPWNARIEVAWGLLFAAIFTLGWVISELYYAVNRDTTVRQLQVDSLVSTGFALFFTFFGAMMICLEILPWWYLFPWIGTIVDSLASGVFAINNAAQKPLITSEQSR